MDLPLIRQILEISMDREEKIGGVTLNYTYYSGTDTYSDGDSEEKLLKLAMDGTDPEEAAAADPDWSVLYHMSPIRRNLLEWYPFRKDGSLLEIGSGCGALTGLFCERTGHVTAVDLSRRRSLINAYRHREHDNLEILVGNFKDICLREKYDYATLIGVLEYSIYYVDAADPFLEMLKKVRSFLKPGGILMIAIENKYGIKYWAGAREDHTGRLFEGITGYPSSDRVRTFSRHGLQELILKAGFEKTEFYYPVPDYKLPSEIWSDRMLPPEGRFSGDSPAYDRDRYHFFNEARAMNSIIEDHLFPEFSNSFLVICQ